MIGAVHEHSLQVRYSETDQMGVVHHASYLAYLEESRTHLMAARGFSYAAVEREGWGLPVRKASLRYFAPALYEDVLLIRTHVERIRPASIVFVSEVVREDGGTRLARGEIELACIRLDDRLAGPQPLPERLRAGLAQAGSGS